MLKAIHKAKRVDEVLVAEEPVLLTRKARPLVDRSHGVLLIAIKPDILCDVWKVTSLMLLDRFPQWLVLHSVELDVLRAMLQSC